MARAPAAGNVELREMKIESAPWRHAHILLRNAAPMAAEAMAADHPSLAELGTVAAAVAAGAIRGGLNEFEASTAGAERPAEPAAEPAEPAAPAA